MANLIRLKQIDKPELSGYVIDVTDESYYPIDNPSGYISSVASNSAFITLSGNLISTGYNLNAHDLAVSGTLTSLVNDTGVNLKNKINTLSVVVINTISDLNTVSG